MRDSGGFFNRDVESKNEKVKVVPAESGMGAKNCIVIEEGQNPLMLEIVRAAVVNKAHIDNSDDEAGDDLYVVQFPGRKQEAMSHDDIASALRELSGDTGE